MSDTPTPTPDAAAPKDHPEVGALPESGSRPDWHAQSIEAICTDLRCTPEGLTEEGARARLERYGPNKLPEHPPPPAWRVLLRQFMSPLIYILIVAAGVSLALGLLDDAIFIAGVLVLNAVIGFVQEYRAEQEIQGLARLLRSTVRVERDGHTRELNSADLVPGDVVLLESGVRVPADMRLIEARGLRVDESLLTGESMPVEKHGHLALAPETALAERRNMVFSGSTVFQGRATGLVVGTAANTEIGLISEAIGREKPVQTPLLARMERFSRSIGIAIVGLCTVVFFLGLYHGVAWSEILMSALALSVSAIPEGLPVALTVALTIGVRRMARRNVLVRHLAAVEGLGSCSVIGTDKTGTLTTNQLTAVAGSLGGVSFTASGVGYNGEGTVSLDGESHTAAGDPLLHRFVRAGALCNEGSLVAIDGAWRWDGDPTDVALLALAHKAGQDPTALQQHHPQTNAIPFEPERRYAASFHHLPAGSDDGGLVAVKGAPERVFEFCTEMWLPGGAERVPFDRDRAMAWQTALVREGYRVLAIAERADAEPIPPEATPEEPHGLTLLGLVGMTDPPREGVDRSIAAANRAGIRVVMITGDHLETARVIGRQIGLGEDAVDSGDVRGLDDPGFAEAVPGYDIFARATPSDKLRIVRAWQDHDHFVAVTGDGVNDAPALRAANIGVAMGKSGTDIARDAAGMVITDDDFSSIVAGVEEGRATYDNVRKVIYLLVSTGLGEVVAVLLAMLSGLPVPFLPAQLLWLNLVTNGIQHVGLAFEPKERELLSRPPRPAREPVFNRIMIERTVLGALVFGLVSFGMFAWLMAEGRPLGEARGMMLNLFVLFEIFHLGNCRSETVSLFRIHPFSNRLLFLGTLGALAIHAFALYFPPLQEVLGAQPLPLGEWAKLAALAATILVVMEAHKAYRQWRPLAR